MALLIGDNFSYNGKKPNFERDSFETLAALKAFAEANIDNGHIAYCVETNKHYIFNDSNSDDSTTGKWRVLESEFSNKVDQSDLTTQLATKEDKFTVGTGLEMTVERVLNVTLDTTVFKVVNSLPDSPAAGDEQKIHLVKAEQTGTQNIYKEYVWADNWELLGEYQSEVDLTPYLTKEEAQTTYQPVGDYATKTELADGLADKQPVGNYATKEELANVSNQIPSLDGYATEEWVTDKNYLTSIPDNYVTEEELDVKNFALKTDLDNKQDKLISGEGGNLATINGADLLQGGNIVIETPEGGISDAPTDGNTYARKDGSWTAITIPDVSNLATKDEIPTKVSQLENDSNFLTEVPAEYVTDEELNTKGYLTAIPEEYITDSELEEKDYVTNTELDTKGYLTSIPDEYVTNKELEEAIADISFTLPIASDTVLGGIKVGSGLTINPDTGILSATSGGVADAVDWANVQSKPQINGHDLVGGNNTLDSLGIQPAGDYALSSEIPSLSGYATEEWVNKQGFLKSVSWDTISNKPTWIGNEKPSYSFSEISGNIATDQLPIATNATLGVVKIGAGLAIQVDGTLSATGGGVADSVNWENVIGRPTNVSQFTNDAGYITNESLPDLSNYALKSDIPTDYLTESDLDSYATQDWVNTQGFLKSVNWNAVSNKPEWIGDTKPSYSYSEITGDIPTDKLPIATTDSLGGIKVGAGLSIKPDGTLSATGGGTADSVEWNNVLNRPTKLSQFTNDKGFITSSSLSIYALKSDIKTEVYRIGELFGIVNPNKEQILDAIGSWDAFLQAIRNSNVILEDEAKGTVNEATSNPILAKILNNNEIYLVRTMFDLNQTSTDSVVRLEAIRLRRNGEQLLVYPLTGITPSDEITAQSNAVTTSKGVYTALTKKQDVLIGTGGVESGQNIKTINGTSLLGAGDIQIEISGGSGSEIIDPLDNKLYARTKDPKLGGTWVDLTDYLTWWEEE